MRPIVVGLVTLALAGCGGGDDTLLPVQGGVPCTGAQLRGAAGLPATFPKPDAVTYIKTEQRGPTRVVNAYYDGGLEDAYEDYRDALDEAGYTILFDELEDLDSEVTYEDPRSQSTGLVMLRKQCREEDRIAVRITNRGA